VTSSRERALVVKLGGEVIATSALGVVAHDIARITRAGVPVVVVHGGGPQASQLQQRLGLETKQVAGRRVTDEPTLDVMKMVVAGKLNVDLCAALFAAGSHPIGLHGASDRVIAAVRRPPSVYAGAGPDPVDLGLVGDITGVGCELLRLLTARGYVPVLACLGMGEGGVVYNINADAVANRVAIELGAEALFLVSDVPGVLRDVADPASRIPRLSMSEGRALIASGVVTKGMIPKLEESFAAVGEGVRRIHILGRLSAGDLIRELDAPGSIGTVLTPG
jgi:acetylglutamate kinase